MLNWNFSVARHPQQSRDVYFQRCRTDGRLSSSASRHRLAAVRPVGESILARLDNVNWHHGGKTDGQKLGYQSKTKGPNY